MYWQLEWGSVEPAAADAPAGAPRFVLHRHHDARGEHLDLRLEEDGALGGWRIDGTAPDGTHWAEEKPPHPLQWLEHDAGAVREDAGVYAWQRHDPQGGELALWGGKGRRVVQVRRVEAPSPAVMRETCQALQAHGLEMHALAALVEDGVVARQRAVARFCGLGGALDGAAFDATVWRRTLAGLSLREIHEHLRAYEVRFDEKYPPQPVSRPEPLDNTTDASPTRVLHILRS